MGSQYDIPDALRVNGDSILVVEGDEATKNSLEQILTEAGYRVQIAGSTTDALQILDSNYFDLLLCDLDDKDDQGMTFLDAFYSKGYSSTVITMSAAASAKTDLEAIKLGAYDCISKPPRIPELLLTLKKGLERERLKSENIALRTQVSRRYSFTNIVGKSASMLEIFETVKKIADYKTTVMLYGESGTGKELVARAIHYNSCRRNKRFVAINCGAIPENLLESELFGHRKGAFTDATRDKKGLFEEAEGGTIFLDEVGELPTHLQVKLLRVLQENEIRPVGDSRIVPINVRVVAATLRDLEDDVIDGRFRDDLFYRLNVVSIRIPPLRERKDDIPLLVNYFLKKNRDKLGLSVFGIDKEAMQLLMEYEWPGNIRELENCIERAMILTDDSKITIPSFPKTLRTRQEKAPELDLAQDELSIKVYMKAVEEMLIKKALEKTRGNRTHAARLLEISHRTLLYKLKEYNLVDDISSTEDN